MAKGHTTIADFAVAPRRHRASELSRAQEDVPTKPDLPPIETQAPENQSPEPGPLSGEADQPASRVIAPTEEARRERARTRALQREESRVRLRDLKRARDRESKHYVNCPLDYDTKKRLEKAALENDVKMTVIMKAAIDQYLRDNGY